MFAVQSCRKECERMVIMQAMSIDLPPSLLTLYPALAEVQPSLASLSATGGTISAMNVPADVVLFEENQPCQGFPMVLEGEVRVSRRSSSGAGEGRSLELYRVLPGELCLVSSSCLFRNDLLSAYGVTTKPTTLLLIPPPVFQQWMATPVFRNEVLGLFASRMADLTSLIDAVAFHKLDQRLAAALLGHGQVLSRTHQDLADELGSVREVVTRLLRRFEREGWVSLSRESIHISDSAALRVLATGQS
jgi:CRP/FNR family transcriptional regulator, anaerobic regulatory protein